MATIDCISIAYNKNAGRLLSDDTYCSTVGLTVYSSCATDTKHRNYVECVACDGNAAGRHVYRSTNTGELVRAKE